MGTPAHSALGSCRDLADIAERTRRQLRRAPLSAADLHAISCGVTILSLWWAWEFTNFLKGCRELAKRDGTPLSVKKIRNDQSLISLVYPRSRQDERALLRSTEARAARALLANRLVARLLIDIDWWTLDARTAPTIAEQLAAGRAILRACDLLERTVSHFVIVESQWIEKIRKQPQRIVAVMSPTVHSRDFFEIARQNLFRELPSNVFYDYEPHVAVLAFRTALERKVRTAVAVRTFHAPRERPSVLRRLRSWVKRLCGKEAMPGRNEVWLINMSDFFEMWGKLKLNILAPRVDVGQLRRLYYWSNQVVHGAERASLPEIWFALEHTLSLFRGVRTKTGGTNITIVSDLTAAEQEVVMRSWLGVPEAWVAEAVGGPH